VKRFSLLVLAVLVIMSLGLAACQSAAPVTKIGGPEDLSGRKVGAQLGTTGAMEAEKIEGTELKTYDSIDLAFLDLTNGQIDAVIADYPTALGFIGQNPDKLTTVGEVFTDESYGIAVCKTNPELLDKINAGLQAVKDDGTTAKLEAKWLQGTGEGEMIAVPAPVEGAPTVRVATDATFPPFETVDEATQDLTGFDVEMMNAIAAKAGINIEWVNIGFDPMLAGLAQCQYDVAIAAITITPERAEQMAFSEPYVEAGQIVVVLKQNAK